MEINRSELLGGGDSRSHRDQAGDGQVDVTFRIEGLYLGNGINAGIVGHHSSIHIVVTLCEVHRGSCSVPGHLPDKLCN